MEPRTVPLTVGDAAPWFTCRSAENPAFQFDTVAGRYIVLCFFASAADPHGHRVLADIIAHREIFDDENVMFFGISMDPDDEQLPRIQDHLPGIRIFWDFDMAVSGAFGVMSKRGDGSAAPYQRLTYVLDERLRVIDVLGFDDQPETHFPRLSDILNRLPPLGKPEPATPQAPVLFVPRVFEPELCRKLIELYEQHGGNDSGFAYDVDGKTVDILDYRLKRRRDCIIENAQLRRECMVRIHDRLAPEIFKAFQFKATRIERFIVACYDSAESGHFGAHRDNTTKGTAHRRFAVSLHLNTGEYEGGLLRFPDFGRQLYSAPIGAAIVFSCSLLHEVTRVTKGKRYLFLPFLYDDAALRIRQTNQQFV